MVGGRGVVWGWILKPLKLFFASAPDMIRTKAMQVLLNYFAEAANNIYWYCIPSNYCGSCNFMDTEEVRKI